MASTSILVSRSTTPLVASAPMGIPENLKRFRETAGLSQSGLAKKAKVSQQLISQLERGENLTTKHLPRIAAALSVPVGDIDPEFTASSASTLGPAVARTGQAPAFAGFVQAGAFLAVDEYFQQDDYPIPEFVQTVPRFGKVRQYAYQAKGDSMTEAGINDGDWVVAADAADFIDAYREAETGDLVVVERSRFQGSERELTVKEIHYFRDRYELRPRSKNPAHKPIAVPHNHKANGDEFEVKIVGIVLTAYKDFQRGRS